MREMESKAKLTLWVDKEAVRFGKELARRNHESLSGLLSGYLVRLKESQKTESLSPLVKKLSGVLKGRPPSAIAYYKHLQKKHLGP